MKIQFIKNMSELILLLNVKLFDIDYKISN